jgi:hypothetical protein
VKLNSYVLQSPIVAALGGLLFGFDTSVIAGTTHASSPFNLLSAGMLGIIVPAKLRGMTIGAMTTVIPGDK